MKLVPFKKSELVSIGMELEFQIINPHSRALAAKAKELIRHIKTSQFEELIKPEITQSMIEINTSVHSSPQQMEKELNNIREFLLRQAQDLGIAFCGGGTHPFQKWSTQKIFPTLRYKRLSHIFKFLSQTSTIFALHMHIGCPSTAEALYLTHALSRYAPLLIALTASSPFYEGVDTGFNSTRSTLFNAYPLSGVIPYLKNWEEFSRYYYKLKKLGAIENMKDFYWDIRPKPEFGTVEVRVCDCPLTFEKAINVMAYTQALALYLLTEKPIEVTPDLYYFYGCNRFQAARYGLEGCYLDGKNLSNITFREDFFESLKKIEHYADLLNNKIYITKLIDEVLQNKNDAAILRQWLKQSESYQKVVAAQCEVWAGSQELVNLC